MNFLKEKLNTENILSVALAFVLLWFGVNEILASQNWVGLVPIFLQNFGFANWLVIFHGSLLSICGLALTFNFYRKIAASIVAFLILEIIFNFLTASGLSDIVVRDMGLFGAAIALIFSKPHSQSDA